MCAHYRTAHLTKPSENVHGNYILTQLGLPMSSNGNILTQEINSWQAKYPLQYVF